MREADHGTDEDGGPRKMFDSKGNVIRLYASCSNRVIFAQLEAGYDFGVGHGGMEERVVYHFGEVGEGDFDSGFVVAIGLGENTFHVESEICSGSEP